MLACVLENVARDKNATVPWRDLPGFGGREIGFLQEGAHRLPQDRRAYGEPLGELPCQTLEEEVRRPGEPARHRTRERGRGHRDGRQSRRGDHKLVCTLHLPFMARLTGRCGCRLLRRIGIDGSVK